MRKADPEKIAGDHPFILEMFQTARIPITLRRYVQPAVNCQPSYCWGISEINAPDAENMTCETWVLKRCTLVIQGPAQVYVWQRRFACGKI